MNMIVYLWYVAFFALIIVGMKFAGKGKWNEDVMSFDQTKAFLGFCSVAIVLHHCSHKTCVDYIPVQYQRPGLEMFVYVGYLCVAAFFFCSGFGLYRSLKTKPDFMKRFPVRFIPILLPYVITLCCFIALRINRNLPVELRNPVTMPDAEPLHPFSWYIFALVILYLSFYIGFGFVKKDWFGILAVAIGSAGYIVFCIIFEYGSWWYNSVPLFLLGILAGKYEERLMASRICRQAHPFPDHYSCRVCHWQLYIPKRDHHSTFAGHLGNYILYLHGNARIEDQGRKSCS